MPRAGKGRRSAVERAKRKPAAARAARVIVLVGTRKGAWLYHGDASRRGWRVDGPHFFGHIVHHMVLDPRDDQTLLVAARTGHLGPTVFRSQDMGTTWTEASRPPAFRKAREGEPLRAVHHVFWLSPGHASEPGVWYAGTSPEGLFRSEDGGDTWVPIAGFNDHPMYPKWTEEAESDYRTFGMNRQNTTPDGPLLHSILIDPRDPKHMYLATSSGGFFESTDQGGDWKPLNAGCLASFLPDPYPEYGQDPHNVHLHPLAPDVLYQQNHCGIYRMERPQGRWVRIGEAMPQEIGDIGFPIVLHPRDPDTVWVFPMDGTTVWPRTSPDGRPAAYCSRDAGRTWQRQDRGLPRAQAWYTVKRQSFTCDGCDPVGLYFGTTSGDVWSSVNEGKSWNLLAAHLPQIHCVVAATVR